MPVNLTKEFFLFGCGLALRKVNPKESMVHSLKLLFHLENRSKNYNSKQIKKHRQMKPYLTIFGRTDVVGNMSTDVVGNMSY